MAKWSNVAQVDDQAEPGLYISLVRGEQINQRFTLNSSPGTEQNLTGYQISCALHFRTGFEEGGRPLGPFSPLMASGQVVADAMLPVTVADQAASPGVFHVQILSSLLPAGVEIPIDADMLPFGFGAISISDGASPIPNIDITRFVLSWRAS